MLRFSTSTKISFHQHRRYDFQSLKMQRSQGNGTSTIQRMGITLMIADPYAMHAKNSSGMTNSKTAFQLPQRTPQLYTITSSNTNQVLPLNSKQFNLSRHHLTSLSFITPQIKQFGTISPDIYRQIANECCLFSL